MATDTEVEETSSSEPEVTAEEALAYIIQQGTPRLLNQLNVGVVNPIELAKALDVKAQMIYNYIRSGRIKGAYLNDTQKLVIPSDSAAEFASSYLSRKARAQAKIEAELAGE